MKETVVIKWTPGAKEKLCNTTPDTIMFEIARETLDHSYPTIPKLTGKTRGTTLAKGVQGSDCKYKIGSYTDYASIVYVRDNNRTNWTTPGTNSYWFSDFFQKYGQSIINSVVERNKLK